MAIDLSFLPTLAEVEASRKGKPILKGESRLQRTVKEDRDEGKEEKRWKKDVWTRDHGRCRWCRRKVEKIIDRKPERAETHHVSGRVVLAIKWDRRNGLLLCLSCHERVTGKVNERFVIVPKKTFTVEGIAYANADKPVTFKRVV